ncbi:hypothetical protein PRIPAC_96695, partial [Pristionchus pacificus]|uniref:G protein-coupled receptor n=1 Tax=Pristionchus pacificus TaxID=54126 RepID=A0A2A6CHD1_PRIPA
MTSTAYAWFYEDPFHSVFLATTTTISILSNGLLLYIIFSPVSTSMGAYRYLLAAFSICDIITSCGHAAFQPSMHMTSSGFYFFPRHGKMVIAGESYDTTFALIFIATYYQTFLVLAYHYVYRYKTVSRGMIASFTLNWKRKEWGTLLVLVYILYTAGFVGTCGIAFTPSAETRALVPPELEAIYGIDLRDLLRGFTVIAVRRPDPLTGEMVWHAPSVLGLLMLLGMFGGTASVILYCIWQTNSIIRSSKTHLTTVTRKLQMDLFKALLIQTSIPLFFSYLPLATVLVFPAITVHTGQSIEATSTVATAAAPAASGAAPAGPT